MHETGGRRGRHVLEAEEQSGESDKRRIDALLASPEPLTPPKLKPPAFLLHSLAYFLDAGFRRHAYTIQMLHAPHRGTHKHRVVTGVSV